MNPWHDIDLGENFPEIVNAVIEIPKGSNAKYRLDAKTGMIKLSEFLPTVARYPANYGFFPRTVAADGDALDVFVFGREAVVPLTLLEVKPLGGVTTHSPKKGIEKKLIAVFPDDPEFKSFSSLKKLPQFYIDELCQFFGEYKQLEGDKKTVKEVFGHTHAMKELKKAADDYAKRAGKGQLEGL